jgi:hypothetical protein
MTSTTHISNKRIIYLDITDDDVDEGYYLLYACEPVKESYIIQHHTKTRDSLRFIKFTRPEINWAVYCAKEDLKDGFKVQLCGNCIKKLYPAYKIDDVRKLFNIYLNNTCNMTFNKYLKLTLGA